MCHITLLGWPLTLTWQPTSLHFCSIKLRTSGIVCRLQGYATNCFNTSCIILMFSLILFFSVLVTPDPHVTAHPLRDTRLAWVSLAQTLLSISIIKPYTNKFMYCRIQQKASDCFITALPHILMFLSFSVFL